MNLKQIKTTLLFFSLTSIFIDLNAEWAGTWINFRHHLSKLFDDKDKVFLPSELPSNLAVGEHGIIPVATNENIDIEGRKLSDSGYHKAGAWRYSEHVVTLIFSNFLQNINRGKYQANIMHNGDASIEGKSRLDTGYLERIFAKFFQVPTDSAKISALNVANASSPADLQAAGFMPINNPSPAVYVEILDEKNLVFATLEGSGEISAVDNDAIQNSRKYFSAEAPYKNIFRENLLFSWRDGQFAQINQRAVDFRHGLKFYSGHLIKTFYSTADFSSKFKDYMRRDSSKKMFSYGGEEGGKNPFNPFDPADPWAVITTIAGAKKHVCFSGNADIWVYGGDGQPYIVMGDPKKAPYLLKYRDVCTDLAVGTNKAAIVYGGKIRVKDISSAKSWKPEYDAANPSSAWRSRYDVSLHEENVVWSTVKAAVTQSNGPVYNSAPFLDGAGEVAGEGKIYMSKDDILWRLYDNKLYKDGTELFNAPAGGIVDFSAGMLAKECLVCLDSAKKLSILADDVQRVWRSTNLIVWRASVGKDGAVAVIDGAGKIWVAKAADVTKLSSPVNQIQGKADAKLKSGVNKFLKSNGMLPASDTSGDGFEIMRHGDIVSIKGKDGYLSVVEGAAKFVKTPAKPPIAESGFGKLEALPGQWVAVAATDGFYLRDRMTGKYLNADFATADAGAVFKFDFTTLGSSNDFDVFIAAVKNASNMNAGDISLSEMEAKLVLLAASCGKTVNDSSFEPSAQTALSSGLINIALGKTDGAAPSALANEARATALVNEFDELTKEKSNQDKISLKPGLANLLNQSLDALSGAFASNRELKSSIAKIKSRFTTEKLGTSFADRIKALEARFTEIRTDKNAEDFVNFLESTSLDRIDVKDNSEELRPLLTLINRTGDMSLNASNKIKDAGFSERINTVKNKLMTTGVNFQEVLDRLERLVDSAGTLTSDQITLVKYFADKMNSLRLKVAKSRTQKLLDILGRIKALNSSLIIPDTISGITFDDFKNKFLKNIDLLWNNRGGTSANTLIDDASALWKQDSPVNEDAKTIKAVDPANYYSLGEFWQDFVEWKNWSPDLTNPENKYPLIRICNQVIDSIQANFSGKSEYQTIKTAAQSMLTELRQ